jgi:drug/metabolite transporter (DMT)-like permease
MIALAAFLARALEIAVTRQIRFELSAVEVAFYRFSLGLAVVSAAMWIQNKSVSIVPRSDHGIFLLRNFSATTALCLLMIGLPHLSLGNSTTIYYLNPLFVVIFAAIALHERVKRLAWVGVGLGFMGVVLISTPSPGNESWAMAIVILGAVFVGPADVALKELRQRGHQSVEAVVSYFAFGTAVLLPVVPFFWKTPSWSLLLMLVLMATLGAVFQWLLGKANGLMLAANVAPLKFTTLVWSQLIDIVCFGSLPLGAHLVGTICISVAAVLATVAQRKSLDTSSSGNYP